MQPTTIDIALGDAKELRNAWLDGYRNGAMFLPGTFAVAAGAPVLVRVRIEQPRPTTTVLLGTVVWRRLPQRDPIIGSSSITLRAGIGVSFAASMQERVLFLDRLARGTASESRGAVRYPAELLGEVCARDSERPIEARLLDVSVRGARVSLGEAAFVDAGSPLEMRVAVPRSGEISRAPLRGRVAWVDRGTRQMVGVKLELATADERLVWAKIVTRAREELEANPLRVDRQVG